MPLHNDYGRLKSTDEGAPGSSSVNILSITYDKNGKIETLNDGTLKDYVYYPSTNKLRNTNGTATNNYTYDANGNMTSSASKTLSMIYDPFTQMTSSVNSSSYNVNLQYTADNERVIKNEAGTGYSDKTLYLRGMNEYPLVEKHTDIAQPDNVYIYGASGLIAVKNSGKTYFIIKDHLGSTRAVVDGATNSPATRYNYLPFGGLKDIASNNITNYRFTGQESDELIGLYNFRARMYDPELGIFLGIDPAGQGFAPFAYAGNNPVIYVDRDGRWFLIDDLIVAGVSFVTGYLSHGLTTGNWGGDALKAGGISAAVGWLAYNTGGAAAGAFFEKGTAGYALTASTVGGTVGGFTGSVANQLAFNGKVDWNLVGRSTLSGLGGGLAGGITGQLSSSSVLPGIIGGAVSGGIEGSYEGQFLQGAFMGSWWGGVSSALTAKAYDMYGKYSTNKMRGEGAYGSDYEGTPIGMKEKLSQYGDEYFFDENTYDCKAYAKDIYNSGSFGSPVAWESNGSPVHVGTELGRTMYGQSMVLSKVGYNGPIKVTTSNYLNSIYGTTMFHTNWGYINNWGYGFGIQIKGR